MMSLTFHWVDIFRFIHATPRTVMLARKCLQNHWMVSLGLEWAG